jgi:heme/copper-type cytochrome/quinol oxidase subunit 4
LDNIKDTVKDTGATLKRADKIVNFFVKAAQCDKCLLGLVISIILALIAFVFVIIKKQHSSSSSS